MRPNIRHFLGVAFTGALVALSTLDCGFTATPCRNPNDSWWDCKLVWTSKRTGNDQTAKAWICAPDSNKTAQSTSAMAAAQTAITAAINEGLACSMPENAVNPKFTCIDSHQHLLPQKPLQDEVDVPTELEKKPLKWGDPNCDQCMNNVCKAPLFDCAQNQFCNCLNTCLRSEHSIDSNGPCLNACAQFESSEIDRELFNSMATCAFDKCNSHCGNAGGPNDDENLQCCSKISCKGQ